ncbi:hypothetical protein SAMN04488527_1367 [Aliiroseovarius crassostreae]|nr:hypothetical protein SAMN04488527_1367 [Aliiroseovarius crassostreae]
MMKQVMEVLSRSSATILQDLMGCVSLVIILFASLHLPGLV